MRRQSWPRLVLAAALAVSVLANVFLLGHAARNIGGVPIAGNLAASVGAAYPPEVRAEFRNLLRENRPRTLVALRDLRQARVDLVRAANAAPLDEAEIERAMGDVRAATEALQRLMQHFLLDALKQKRGTT